jgi:gamma-glutamyltranspeptidase/glutathione hydrolase
MELIRLIMGITRRNWIAWLVAGLALSNSGSLASAEQFSRHVVAAQEANAADIGREVMRRGGNAIDASIATAFALAVTLPEAGNLGGGGFIVAYLADRREVVTVDFREMAPGTAEARMYLDAEGKLRPRNRAGAWAAGVPGTVRGLGLAHARYGKTRWPELVRPAVRLAREGFSISADLASSLNRQLGVDNPERRPGRRRDEFGSLGDFPESVAAFAKPDRTPWREGDRLIQSDLAGTLNRIAEVGPDEFYSGKTAQMIADYMAGHAGYITRDDLKSYQAKLRPPVHTSFRGHDVYSIGPPSAGGIVLCQMLNILERFDLKADGRDSPRTLHRVTEAMRRAFYTRATQVADPDFGSIPVDELTSKAYADKLARTIGEKATSSHELAPFTIATAESDHTTHLSSLDQAGNAVALTYTLEDSYGAKCVVAGAGFLLNNEMGDFNLTPGRTDTAGRIGTPPNLIAPHKRMLSSQTPTILIKEGKARVVTGSPGGRTIPNTVLWVVLNLAEFGLSPQEAVDAPRTHHQWFPDVLVLEGRSWPAALRSSLTTMGHKLGTAGHQGNANTIVVDADGRPQGIADRRRLTAKASGD